MSDQVFMGAGLVVIAIIAILVGRLVPARHEHNPARRRGMCCIGS